MRQFVVLGIAGALALLLGSSAREAGARPDQSVTRATGGWQTLERPIDPRQQTLLRFGDRSHWLQPWRAYLETVPATRLLQATGIQFNVPPHEARLYARVLARAGFRRARYEIGWNSVSYGDPQRLVRPGDIRMTLAALRDNGIRPLILLNANHLEPNPTRSFDVRVLEPAGAGARSLVLDAASAGLVVPRRSGLNALDGSKAAAILFTSVEGSRVTLSKALPRGIEAGIYRAAAFRYQPFDRPGTAVFEETMRGWLEYVDVVTRVAKDVLRGQEFDVEIWNELTFGSDFLNISRYYDDAVAYDAYPETTGEIARRTVAWIRAPANGVSRIGIANGFASQVPWPSRATEPLGLTAISKHPYAGRTAFPGTSGVTGFRPLDALGRPGTLVGLPGSDRWRDAFLPRYSAFFPEYFLTAIQTEHLVRDLSPFTTSVYGTPHGRRVVSTADSSPGVWVTEVGLEPTQIPPRTRSRVQAKAALRYFVSWVNKGAGAVYLFAARDSDSPWALAKPKASGGGEAMRAMRRLTAALRGPRVGPIRPLSLLAVSDRHGQRQFDGDGTRAHPPLYNRDVLAFLPFQVTPRRHVVAVYVMTRDLTMPLAAAPFRLVIGGVRAGTSVRASDPLTGRRIPVKIVSRRHSRIVVELSVTDSPRLLELSAPAR